METGNPGCEMRGKGKNLTTMVDTHEEHGNPKVGKSTRELWLMFFHQACGLE